MTDTLFPGTPDFNGAFPKLSRRLRLGIVGGGRVSGMQAMAARMTDYWDIVAGALSSDPEKSKRLGAQGLFTERTMLWIV